MQIIQRYSCHSAWKQQNKVKQFRENTTAEEKFPVFILGSTQKCWSRHTLKTVHL